MAYEHKDGQGSMFRNEKQNDRQPDYKGTIVINGTTYEIAGWERTSQKGSQYISLQAALPRERGAQDGRPSYERSQYGTSGYSQAPSYGGAYAPQETPMPTADDMMTSCTEEDLPF